MIRHVVNVQWVESVVKGRIHLRFYPGTLISEDTEESREES
jgi:hypothetical protein